MLGTFWSYHRQGGLFSSVFVGLLDSKITQNLLDIVPWNLVERCNMGQGRTNHILEQFPDQEDDPGFCFSFSFNFWDGAFFSRIIWHI